MVKVRLAAGLQTAVLTVKVRRTALPGKVSEKVPTPESVAARVFRHGRRNKDGGADKRGDDCGTDGGNNDVGGLTAVPTEVSAAMGSISNHVAQPKDLHVSAADRQRKTRYQWRDCLATPPS